MASNLLKEAIADAKAVRETAIANAKLALEEAFTPRLQSMLSNKIEEELDNEESTEEADVNPVDEQSGSSQIGTGDNKVDQADGDDEEKTESETSSAAAGDEGEEETVDKLTENEGEEEDEEAVTEGEDEEDEATEDDETDAELEEIIRELEGEDEEEATEEEELEAPADEETEYTEEEELEAPAEDEATEEDYAGEEDEATEEDDEELNIESILKALKEEDDDEDEAVEEIKEQLKEAYNTIKSLKATLNEVNLLNAKLLFSNKLFKAQSLTESQKMRVIETFDRAHSLREVKLVYTTLAESLKSPVKTTAKKLRTEGLASKAQKTTKPKTVIAEGNDMASRMKKLAGLL